MGTSLVQIVRLKPKHYENPFIKHKKLKYVELNRINNTYWIKNIRMWFNKNQYAPTKSC